MIMDDYEGQMMFGDLMGLKLPDIHLTAEEKPRKNLTQETCPDQESNPGLLRGKRACYHLLHSGGLDYNSTQWWAVIWNIGGSIFLMRIIYTTKVRTDYMLICKQDAITEVKLRRIMWWEWTVKFLTCYKRYFIICWFVFKML